MRPSASPKVDDNDGYNGHDKPLPRGSNDVDEDLDDDIGVDHDKDKSWADLLEEETEDRQLLDPVDEERGMIETLLSMGVDGDEAMAKVSEIYSPPRVTDMANRRPGLNIKGLGAFDLSTPRPGGGNWDFNIRAHREEVKRICAEEVPDWLIGCPPMY